MSRPFAALVLAGLALLSVGAPALAAPHRLTDQDRAELTRLARTFFEATRDGTAARASVFPTPAELRALFPGSAAARAGAAPSGLDSLVTRHVAAIERDVRDLRERFRGGTFTGLAGPVITRGVIDLERCGRFARAGTQCGDGPVIEYAVQGERRRFRIDRLVRINGRWRIFDARP